MLVWNLEKLSAWLFIPSVLLGAERLSRGRDAYFHACGAGSAVYLETMALALAAAVLAAPALATGGVGCEEAAAVDLEAPALGTSALGTLGADCEEVAAADLEAPAWGTLGAG